ncbi:MAG: EAL domain-containing protein [Oceanospirillales bacterium]|nr:EAL domain-containing protein [Oceanospirillales bacterium]
MTCAQCADGAKLDFEFSMAFQPIVDIRDRSIYSQEALVRGVDGSSAASIFRHVHEGNRYAFDQACRVKAVNLAAQLGIDSYLNINFIPTAVYRPEVCIRTTLEAASIYGFPSERIIFEFTENDHVDNPEHLSGIVDYYRDIGFQTAIDDFGSGYSGLGLLADIQTDMLKIDMALIRNIHADPVRRAIVRSLLSLCDELHITLMAEGIENKDELRCLSDLGIHLYQGYYFAKPSFESLAEIDPETFDL